MTFKNWIKQRYNSAVFALSAQNHPIILSYWRNFYKPSKGSLAAFLDNLSRENFSVFQVGANDGFSNDPIHKYIKRDGWKGILLEPQKQVFEEKLSKVYRKSSGIVTLNAALGEEDGEMPLYKLNVSDARWASGLSTFDRQTLVKNIENGYVAKKAAKEGLALPNSAEEMISIESVAVRSPASLCREHKIETIDLLQVDAEGYDAQVIELFFRESILPKNIVFEHIHLSAADKERLEQSFTTRNYILNEYGANTVAVLCV